MLIIMTMMERPMATGFSMAALFSNLWKVSLKATVQMSWALETHCGWGIGGGGGEGVY